MAVWLFRDNPTVKFRPGSIPLRYSERPFMPAFFVLMVHLTMVLGIGVPAEANEPSEKCRLANERSDYLWTQLEQLGQEIKMKRDRVNEANKELAQSREEVLPCLPALGDLLQSTDTACSRLSKNYEEKRREVNIAVEEYTKLAARHNTDTQEWETLQSTLDECQTVSTAGAGQLASDFDGQWDCGFPGTMKISGRSGEIWGNKNQGWGPHVRKGGTLSNVTVNGTEAKMDVAYGDGTKGTFKFNLNKDGKSMTGHWEWNNGAGRFSCKK